MARHAPASAGNWVLLMAAIAVSTAGCGSDDATDGGGKTPEPLPAGCSIAISPSSNDVQALQGALIDAKTDGTICLRPGTYTFDKMLTLAGTAGITVKGVGATRDEVVLDFLRQTSGDDAFTVDADTHRFTLENLTVKDPPGDGVKVTNSDRPTFRNVRAYYSAGSVPENGAYALYPVLSTNVLIEDCEVEGSSDAGIYLGQSATGIVRNNKAHGNVVGIEAENSTDIELYGNEAWDNTNGFLIVNLPGLVRQGVARVSAHDNHAYDNNRDNFGPPTGFLAGLPPGAGVLVMDADETELFNNKIEDNSGMGVLIVSWPVYAAVGQLTHKDKAYDEFLNTSYVHDNTFSGNGQNPHGGLELIGPAPLEDIVWDGHLDPNADPATADERRICIRNNGTATFRNFAFPDGLTDTTKQSTDLAPHDCSYPALSPVKLP